MELVERVSDPGRQPHGDAAEKNIERVISAAFNFMC